MVPVELPELGLRQSRVPLAEAVGEDAPAKFGEFKSFGQALRRGH
jgi:hypothetical protein